jgi:hypothetical protein
MLLAESIESLLKDIDVNVWAFGRDQAKHQRGVAGSLKERVRESAGVIILLSKSTLVSGATQWMELAYADAYGIPAFILLHHLTYNELRKMEPGPPPLVMAGHCTLALEWRSLENDLRNACTTKAAGRDVLKKSAGIGRPRRPVR